jgi:NAD(P)H-hydrate repair Nnr-like enzyme with NAD(P)H-hydrate dehydratase domain
MAQRKQQQQEQQDAAASLHPLMLAAYGGCLTMRAAAVLTFSQLRRSMLAEDMIKHLGDPVLEHAGLLPPDGSEEERAKVAKL